MGFGYDDVSTGLVDGNGRLGQVKVALIPCYQSKRKCIRVLINPNTRKIYLYYCLTHYMT